MDHSVNKVENIFIKPGLAWFAENKWEPFAFQTETWEAHRQGQNGLVNAPTGSGKTYSLIIPILLEFIRDNPTNKTKKNNGLQAIWITPIRSLGREIELSANRAIAGLGLGWRVGVRSGDTSGKKGRNKKKNHRSC